MGHHPWPDEDGVPSLVRDGVPPGIGQQEEYLLHGEWYASGVHAGGLSWF